MDKADAQKLARMQAHQPEATCQTLRDSGFGELADAWVSSRADFDAERSHSSVDRPNAVLQAFARMRMCWFKINQLKETAQRQLDHRDH